jgi:formylglycine-generating enzyme required for sulfatase activity
MDEGECADGAVGEEECGICGTRSRICDSTCHWRPWSACVESGGCARGTTRIVRTGCPEGEIKQETCDSTCSWVVDLECTSDCIIPRRTGGDQEEVCVTGGLFIMGSDETDPLYADRSPAHEVVVSPFLIDKYSVTNRRYRECVLAGVCTPPRNTAATYFNIHVGTYSWYPVTYLLRSDAHDFCTWDGGRVFPTEAEWEKAARGPAPRQVPYPWGTDTDYCTYVNHYSCGTGRIEAVNAYPLNVSFYGVVGMMSGFTDYVADNYSATYYVVSPRLDPIGPEAATGMLSDRGYFYSRRLEDDTTYPPLTARLWDRGPSAPTVYNGLRCARRPWSE